MKEFYLALEKLPMIRKQLAIYSNEIIKETSSDEEEKNRVIELVDEIIEDMKTSGVALTDEDNFTLIKTTLHVLFLKQLSFTKLGKKYAEKIRSLKTDKDIEF